MKALQNAEFLPFTVFVHIDRIEVIVCDPSEHDGTRALDESRAISLQRSAKVEVVNIPFIE